MATKKVVSLELGWPLVLKALGLQGDTVLRRAKLPSDLFALENVKLTTDEYFRLWDALAQESGQDSFPIRLAELVSAEMFHPVIFASLCSPNLRVAVNRTATYKRLVAPMKLLIEERPGSLFIGFEWLDSELPVPPSLALTELTYLVRIARIGTREHICPLKVETPHQIEKAQLYQEFFGVAPQVSSRHGVTFSWLDSKRPFLTSSGAMWDIFEPHLRQQLVHSQSTPPTISSRIRKLLLESLPAGQASIETIAERLALSPRTIQRQLKTEGSTFRELLDTTRRELALNYVTKTNLAYPEIAFLLGFSEVSSFFRSFRRWTQSTPEHYRSKA